MVNPTIEELNNEEKFELIGKLNHSEIKDFVIQQLSDAGKTVRIFMIYQIVMVLTGMFFITRSVVLAFQQSPVYFYYSVGALLFCFTLLIIIHESIHGIALKLTGAKNINFGLNLKQFIFYVEADRHVLNRRQFAFVALAPLVLVKLVTLAGIVFFFNSPLLYPMVIIMSTHSLFCAGDIGLLSVFGEFNSAEIYTYDIKAEKTSYYFRKR